MHIITCYFTLSYSSISKTFRPSISVKIFLQLFKLPPASVHTFYFIQLTGHKLPHASCLRHTRSLLLTINSIGIPREVGAGLDAGETLANPNDLIPTPRAGDFILLLIDVQVSQTPSQRLDLLGPQRGGEGLSLWFYEDVVLCNAGLTVVAFGVLKK